MVNVCSNTSEDSSNFMNRTKNSIQSVLHKVAALMVSNRGTLARLHDSQRTLLVKDATCGWFFQFRSSVGYAPWTGLDAIAAKGLKLEPSTRRSLSRFEQAVLQYSTRHQAQENSEESLLMTPVESCRTPLTNLGCKRMCWIGQQTASPLRLACATASSRKPAATMTYNALDKLSSPNASSIPPVFPCRLRGLALRSSFSSTWTRASAMKIFD